MAQGGRRYGPLYHLNALLNLMVMALALATLLCMVAARGATRSTYWWFLQGPTLGVMISPIMFAALRSAAYTRKMVAPRIPALEPVCKQILGTQTRCFQTMATVDVALLINVILSAWKTKALLLPPAYLQMLKVRYRAPASAAYHQAVWAEVNSRVAPLLQRAPAIVQRAVRGIQVWFTAM